MRVRTEVGDRVLLVGQHPWVGHVGEVVTKAPSGVVTVRLEHGGESMAWPKQYRKLARGHGGDGGTGD